MDFNVLNMTATVNVIRAGLPLTVGELTKVRDTPEMAPCSRSASRTRATASRSTRRQRREYQQQNASGVGFEHPAQGGVHRSGEQPKPAVKDRINAVNGMLLNDEGARRWLVNTDRCPTLTEALEQQAYDKNGEPDKSTGRPPERRPGLLPGAPIPDHAHRHEPHQTHRNLIDARRQQTPSLDGQPAAMGALPNRAAGPGRRACGRHQLPAQAGRAGAEEDYDACKGRALFYGATARNRGKR